MSLSPEESALLAHVLETRGSALHARAWAIVRDVDAARDLVQEAVTRLLVHLPRSKTEASLAACLFRTVHNLSLNETRRRKRSARCEAQASSRARREVLHTRRGEPVVEHAIEAEGASAARTLLRVLTLLERQAVTLVHLERRTVPEAAARLGLREKVVHRALGRARRKLWNLCAPRVRDGVDPNDVAAVMKGVMSLDRVPTRGPAAARASRSGAGTAA